MAQQSCSSRFLTISNCSISIGVDPSRGAGIALLAGADGVNLLNE